MLKVELREKLGRDMEKVMSQGMRHKERMQLEEQERQASLVIKLSKKQAARENFEK